MFPLLHIVNNTYHTHSTMNMPPALCFATPVPRQKVGCTEIAEQLCFSTVFHSIWMLFLLLFLITLIYLPASRARSTQLACPKIGLTSWLYLFCICLHMCPHLSRAPQICHIIVAMWLYFGRLIDNTWLDSCFEHWCSHYEYSSTLTTLRYGGVEARCLYREAASSFLIFKVWYPNKLSFRV